MNQPVNHTALPPKQRRLYIPIAVMGLLVLAVVWYATFVVTHTAGILMPMRRAALRMRIELIQSHLMIEESLSGKTGIPVESVQSRLAATENSFRAVREDAGRAFPAKHSIGVIIDRMQHELDRYHAAFDARLADPQTSRIGTPAEIAFDEISSHLLEDAEKIELMVDEGIQARLAVFTRIQAVLVTLALVLSMAAGLVLHTYNRHRSAYMAELQAANQQLDAANQQLEAGNQQLRAHEQQLKSANQQLAAGEQQLRAANQQLRAGEGYLREERDKADRYLELVQVMLVGIDADQKIMLLNRKGCEILGVRPEEVMGRNWFDTFLPPARREPVKQVFNQLIAGVGVMAEHYENPVITAGGEERLIAWHNTVLKDRNGKVAGTLSAGEDVTERRAAEAQIHASLREKEVLLGEIHHRVKNNLNIICSLLELQSMHVQDKQALQVLSECQDRIYTMSLVHDQLYHSKDLALINFREYAETMINRLLETYETGVAIELRLDLAEAELDIKTAIPLGLLLHELFSNAVKHAFKGRTEGLVRVTFAARGANAYELTVHDDGVGMPPELDIEKTATLGMQLVNILAMQLGARPVFERRNGTLVRIEIRGDRA